MSEHENETTIESGEFISTESEMEELTGAAVDDVPAEAVNGTHEPVEEDAAEESSAEEPADPQPIRSPRKEAIFTIRLLTAVAVGGVVEGTDQLVTRLKQYEEKLRQAEAAAETEGSGEGEIEIDENELDLLRYATIGLIFDTQNMIGRSLELALKAAETGVSVTEKIAGPFWDFFLFRPVTRRVEKRVDNMADRGQNSLSRWIEIGRQVEPRGRALATFTYEEIVSEFIDRLADSPELQELVAQQSLSLAAGVRDEVRERTVTGDNVLEDIARRILRREPRPQLAEPPPEVQRWAGISPEDFKELEKEQIDEQRSEDSTQ